MNIGPINRWDPSIEAFCPSSCKCKSDQYKVDEAGNCGYWCSKDGYCGDSADHIRLGIDCSDCKGSIRSCKLCEK